MANDYDVIVAGLGAMGSAAAYHLAASGKGVLGLDRFHPPHEFGSSHGLTRIIREAYFEHPAYVPVVQRAYELWTDLERQSNRQIYLPTGGAMIGPAGGLLVRGAEQSAKQHQLAHRVLTAAELRRELPAFRPADDMVAIWEPRAGVLFPEIAIQTHLELAAKRGAELRFHQPILKWEATRDGVRVFTAHQSYSAARLLLSAGAWMSSLLSNLKLPLKVERQVLFWFEPTAGAEQFGPRRCPVFICEYAPQRYFYGLPDLGDGFKVALHHQGGETQPESVRREVSEEETGAMRDLICRFLPEANGRLRGAAVCLYTNTPDEHFILDLHPAHEQVLIASPCSGHGFKFSSVIGETAAQLLTDRQPPFDLRLFSLKRFAST